MMQPHPLPAQPPALTAAEAAAVVGRLSQAMEALLGMIEEETALVRAGRLREAALISVEKAEFARSYVTDMTRLAANGAALALVGAEQKNAFKERQAHFQERLRQNMTVLATAHAVSEDIIRGVSSELARKAAPQTYGTTGRPAYGGPSTIQPLAVSRSL